MGANEEIGKWAINGSSPWVTDVKGANPGTNVSFPLVKFPFSGVRRATSICAIQATSAQDVTGSDMTRMVVQLYLNWAGR